MKLALMRFVARIKLLRHPLADIQRIPNLIPYGNAILGKAVLRFTIAFERTMRVLSPKTRRVDTFDNLYANFCNSATEKSQFWSVKAAHC